LDNAVSSVKHSCAMTVCWRNSVYSQ